MVFRTQWMGAEGFKLELGIVFVIVARHFSAAPRLQATRGRSRTTASTSTSSSIACYKAFMSQMWSSYDITRRAERNPPSHRDRASTEKENKRVARKTDGLWPDRFGFLLFHERNRRTPRSRPRPSLTLVTKDHRQSTDSPALSFLRSEHLAFSAFVRASTMAPRPGKSARKIWQNPKKKQDRRKDGVTSFKTLARRVCVVCVWVVGCRGNFVDSIAGCGCSSSGSKKTTAGSSSASVRHSKFWPISQGEGYLSYPMEKAT